MLDLPSLSRPLRRHVCKMLEKKDTDEEVEGYGENPICCSLLVPLPCRMERWIDWSIVIPDTGSVWCVIQLPCYALFVTYFVPRSTLQLYLWFLSLLVSQVPFFPSALLLLQSLILGALANVHLTHQFGFGKVGIDADLKRFEIWVLTWLCDYAIDHYFGYADYGNIWSSSVRHRNA